MIEPILAGAVRLTSAPSLKDKQTASGGVIVTAHAVMDLEGWSSSSADLPLALHLLAFSARAEALQKFKEGDRVLVSGKLQAVVTPGLSGGLVRIPQLVIDKLAAL